MPLQENADIQYTSKWGAAIPLPQHEKADGSFAVTGEKNPMPIMSLGMLPFEKQSNVINYKQTHTSVTIPVAGASGYSDSAWFPTDGAESIKIVIAADSTSAYSAVIQWSFDGTNFSGEEPLTLVNGTKSRNASTKVDVAAPFFRVSLINGHTATRVMSAWAALKA